MIIDIDHGTYRLRSQTERSHHDAPPDPPVPSCPGCGRALSLSRRAGDDLVALRAAPQCSEELAIFRRLEGRLVVAEHVRSRPRRPGEDGGRRLGRRRVVGSGGD
jgi:hypothetical protein